MANIEQTTFKGIANDRGKKFTSPEYFYKAENYNFDDVTGSNKTLMPEIALNSITTDDIDGIFEYRYTNSSNVAVVENIVIYGGTMYKGLLGSALTSIYTNLTAGKKCSFTIHNDRLFVTNGVDFAVIYDGVAAWQMGAPKATDAVTSGNLNGTYYYEVTYEIDGIYSRLGTKSNSVTISNGQVTLDVPTGHPNITARKIYRTIAGGSTPRLVATISDNTTTSYTDNTADGSLGADIGEVNDECPKPKYITVIHNKLVGIGVSKKPKNVFVGALNKEFLLNTRGELNVSNVGNDNTDLVGMAIDYNDVVIASKKHIYLLQASGVNQSENIVQTQANIGAKDGDAMIRVPSSATFPGGVMFPSSLNDIRVFNGNIAQPIATSLDNMSTENVAEVIQDEIRNSLDVASDIHAVFHDYKYLISVNDIIYSFDIRGNKWSTIRVKTTTYESIPNYLAVINKKAYIGQKGASIVEQMYALETYRGENYDGTLVSQDLLSGSGYKHFKELQLYFVNADNQTVDLEITIDSDRNNKIQHKLEINGGSFVAQDFESDDFDVSDDEEDFKVVHIHRYGKWMNFKIISSEKSFTFRGFFVAYRNVSNQEGGNINA